MNESYDLVERDKGILNKRDRRFLLGELDEELTDNAQNVRRYEIRNRLENAIYDFQLLARRLPYKDIRQVFDPVDDWSRERRKINEEFRESRSPSTNPFIQSWIELFEFFTISMYANGMPESRDLMAQMIKVGIEKGFRRYQLAVSDFYQGIDTELTIQYTNPVTWETYLEQIVQDFPNAPSERYAEIKKLYDANHISYNQAMYLYEGFVKNEINSKDIHDS